MACLVNRKDNKITSVKTETGKESKLFRSIHAIPFLAGSETSLETYKNVYSKKVQKEFEGATENVYDTGEPILYIVGKDGVYNSVEEAIIADEKGDLQAAFKSPKNGEMMPFLSFRTHNNERGEFIYSMIQQGFLSPERVLDKNGDTHFEGKGKHHTDKSMGAHATKFEAYINGNARVKITTDGKVTIPNTESTTRVEGKDGSVKYIKSEDVLEEVRENDPENKIDMLYDYYTTVDKVIPDYSRETVEDKQEVEDLRESFMDFLELMGFNTMTLQAYSERYKNTHGKDPDVQALADMANKIVAFREGKIGIEDLSEEVAHIAIEFYADQNSIASALSVVHLTEEYAEYAEYYRNKYKVQHPNDPVALEEAVRKEVLGKILKAEFLDRFSTENKSAERLSLIDKLKEMWSEFVDFLSMGINTRHINEIKKLNEQIADSVLSGKIGNFDMKISSDNVYYSAMSKSSRTTEAKLQLAKKYLEDLYRKELGTQVPNKSVLDKISEDMELNNVISSVNSLAGIVESQSKILLANLRQSIKEDKPSSREDDARREYIEKSRELLNGLIETLKRADFENKAQKDTFERILATMKTADSNYNEALPLIEETSTKRANAILEKILSVTGATAEQKQDVRDRYNSDQKDISFIGHYFGLMSSMANPVLGMMAKLVKDMKTMVNKDFLNTVAPFLTKVEAGGHEKFQKTIIKERNGKATHFYDNPIAMDLFEKDKQAKQEEIVKRLKPELTIEEIQEKLKKESAFTILGTQELQNQYSKEIREWQRSETENRNNQAYEDQKNERFENAIVSEVTKEVIANKNAARRARDLKYQNKDGNIDNSKKSDADKLQDQIERNSYRSTLSPLHNGQVRPGLRIIDMSTVSAKERERLSAILPFQIDENFKGEIIVPDGTITKIGDYEELANNLKDDESRTSLDLNSMNMRYRQDLNANEREKGFNDQFKKSLQEVHDRGESAYGWAVQNGTMSFTSEYYDQLTSEDFVGYVDAAQNMINSMTPGMKEREEYVVALKDIKERMSQKRHISKQYRKEGNPMETDVSSMVAEDRKKLLEIDTEIERLKKRLSVPQDYFSDSSIELSERILTQDFYDAVELSGLSEYEFSLGHMTVGNQSSTLNFGEAVRANIYGFSTKVTKSQAEFIDKHKSKLVGKSEEESIEILKDEFAKSKVAGYYQKFEPKGSTKFLNSLKDTEGQSEKERNEKFENLKKFLDRDANFLAENDVAKYVEVTPDHTWSNDIGNEQFRNGRYMADEYYLQPRLTDKDGKPSKYVDLEFFNKYGVDVNSWLKNPTLDLSKLEATKNKEEFEYLKNIIEIKEKTLEKYKETGAVSKFQRAQVYKTTAEKFAGAVNPNKVGTTVAAAKDTWRSIWNYRVDEKDAGETAGSGRLNVRTIPTYYLDRVEDPEMLSENTIQTELMMYKEASLYEARKSQEADLNALLRKIEMDNIKSVGLGGKVSKIEKGGQASNLYKKAEEYLGANLYGIAQTRNMQTTIMGRDVNLTKVINVIQSITRFGNLAFHPLIDITSFTTGQTVNWADRFAGDYYHKSSFDRALLATPKVFKYLSESGKVHKKSELNHLLELFMVESVDDRLSNSAQGRVIKLLDKSPYGMSKVSNMGIKPQIMFSNIMDLRYIDGKFQNWQQYYNSQRVNDKSKDVKIIEAEFKLAEKDSLYDNLDIRKDGIGFNEKFKEKFENPEEAFNEVIKKAASKIENLIQITDTVISDTDRTAAQRDVFTNQFMMHKGWLPIQLTKRFKAEHLNFTTGEVEQGHYLLLADIFKSLVRDKSLKATMNMIAELPLHQRANGKRIVAETAMLAAIMVLAQFIFAADDDDDSYLEDVLQYSFLRMSREFHASTLTGIGKSVIETMKSPITTINTLENLEPFTLLSSAGALIKGDTKPAWKTLKSMTVAKRFDQLTDMQGQIDKYFFFNDMTIPFKHPIKERNKELREEAKKIKESREAERTAASSMSSRK